MNKLLENIFSTKSFITSKNETIKINSETSKKQCEFLQKIISTNKFSSSIEIGFAYGMSTLSITEEIVKNGGKHVVIDKFEQSSWNGVGLDLINQAGFSKDIEFINRLVKKYKPMKFYDPQSKSFIEKFE